MMAVPFVRIQAYLLMRAGSHAPQGYRALLPIEAPGALLRVSRAPGVMESVYRLWLSMVARSSSRSAFAPTQADHARALQWALGQLGARGSLVLCRTKLAGPGPLSEVWEAPRAYVPEPKRPDERHWIQFDLQDQVGNPIAGAPYAILRGKDVVKEGALDRFGTVYLDAIDPGSYRFEITSAEPQPPEGDFLALELLDDQGEPVAGARYRVKDAASEVHEGVLDAGGRALLEGIAPGACEVTFPEWRDDAKVAP